MPKTIELALPDDFENQLKTEMQVAALNAFKSVAGKHAYSEYMQRKDAAEYLGVGVSTLDTLTRRGAPTILVDGLKLYKKASLDKWLLAHEH